MAPVACPKWSVVVYKTASGAWRFDPPNGCVDLEGTEWGAKGEFEWCPTLAVAMPDEVFWPGQSHRDHVMRVAEQGQAQRKIGRDSPAKKPRRSGASRATWKPSPRNGARGRLDLRRSRERVCIKLTTSAKSTSTKSQLPRRPARFSKKPRLFGGQFNGVFWFQVKAGIDLLIG
jgi:hypothetical protein